MKNIKTITSIIGLLFLSFLLGCSPENIDSGTTSTYTGTGTTTSTPSAMLLTASDSSISGGGQSDVTAYVVDNIGHPVANAWVTFSIDSGLKGSLDTATVQTNTNGQATVQFTAGSTATTATITGAIGSVKATTDIAIGGGGGGTVNVTSTFSSISTLQTTTIKAVVRNSSNALVANTLVNFQVDNTGAASLSATSDYTDSNGEAFVVLTGTAAWTVQVTASSTTYGSNSTTITITSSATDAIIVSASPSSSLYTYGSATINALVTGPSYTPPPTGLTVNFTISNPSVATLLASSATTNNGTASVGLTAGAVPGSATITATYGTLSNTTTITTTAPPTDSVIASANTPSITVYGTATITALVTAASRSVPDGTSVSFVLGDSTLGTLSATTVLTVSGKATTTFSASNKPGTATISAIAGSARSDLTLPIMAASAGSIQFVSANPQLIGLKTVTTDPTSLVIFAVKDINGNPASEGTTVTFSMNGPGGGEYIGDVLGSSTYTASTINGQAQVILHSGNVAGPVTIIASTDVGSGTISSSATQVSIGGGVPSAGHWNLATSVFNLPGYLYSDKQATITAYIADRFGNFNILTGTALNFYAEAGAISTQGLTDSTGKASVTFRTQSPNPKDVTRAQTSDTDFADYAGYFGNENEPHLLDGHNVRDGWLTILATAMGEEAFLDENGDGSFTRNMGAPDGCTVGYKCECTSGTTNYTSVTGGAACGTGNRSEPFLDLGEPFYDANDNEKRDTLPFEQYIDANKNGAYNAPNARWDGPDCTSSGCLQSKMIWKDIRLLYSGNPVLYSAPTATNCYECNLFDRGMFADAPTDPIDKGGKGSFTVYVGDSNLNRLEPGSTIAASASVGTITITESTNPIPDGLSTGPTLFSFDVEIPVAATQTSTTVGVTVTTKSGYVLSYATSVPLRTFAITTPNPLPNGTSGGAYSVTMTITGGTTPFTWSATGLPAGLSIDSATGVISGTITAGAGSVTDISVTVTDNNGITVSKTYSMTIQ